MKQSISKPQDAIVSKPYVLALRITNRCMTGCSHCSGGYGPAGEDMGEDLFSRACSQARALGIMTVHLTGGEPLLHPRIESLVAMANAEGLIPELVTSIYSPGHLPAVRRLESLCKAGLKRVMVSFDDPHAGRVTLEDMAAFLQSAVSLDLDTGVNVVECDGAKWDVKGIRQACLIRSVPVERIHWCASHLSKIGRASEVGHQEPDRSMWARCAFSLTSPTVDPDGVVLVCCSSTRDLPGFVLGNLRHEDLETCVDRLLAHPLCRANAFKGPHEAWIACGLPPEEMHADACLCCFGLSAEFAKPDVQARLESLSFSLPEYIPLDYEALNAWCRKAVPADAPRIGETRCVSSRSH